MPSVEPSSLMIISFDGDGCGDVIQGAHDHYERIFISGIVAARDLLA